MDWQAQNAQEGQQYLELGSLVYLPRSNRIHPRGSAKSWAKRVLEISLPPRETEGPGPDMWTQGSNGTLWQALGEMYPRYLPTLSGHPRHPGGSQIALQSQTRENASLDSEPEWPNLGENPPDPMNHVKIFNWWPLQDAPSELVQLWYKSFPWGRFLPGGNEETNYVE